MYALCISCSTATSLITHHYQRQKVNEILIAYLRKCSGCDSPCLPERLHCFSFLFLFLCFMHTLRVTSLPQSSLLYRRPQWIVWGFCDWHCLFSLLSIRLFFYFIYLYIKAKQALSVLSLFMMARSAAQLRELSQRTLERNNRCFFSQSCCTSLDRCAPVLPLSHEGRCVVLSWGAVEERTLLCGRIMCPCRLTKRWCFTAAVSFDSVPILCNKPQLKWLMELNRYLMTKTKFKLLFGTQEETFQDSDTVRLS